MSSNSLPPPRLSSAVTTSSAAAAVVEVGATVPSPIFTLEEFFPIYFSVWERETGLCSICCNQVEGPCVVCQTSAEATSVECSITWGECGHAFHTHCIEKWLRTRPVCPLDNKSWRYRTEWNTATM